MRNQPALTPRQRDVLYSIVETYIATGEPVASRTIASRGRDVLSPATIRNVMADLDEGGYLDQPHTSAGRVPTEKAFRAYVESLTARRLSPRWTSNGCGRDLGGADSVTERIARSTHFLTAFTRNIGIAAAIPASSQILSQIELLKLADSRVLMIVVTRDRMIRDRVVVLDQEISQDELHSIGNYVNRNFSGWKLAEARQELERRLEQESAAYDAILKRLVVLSAKGLLDFAWAPEIYMEGASNLVTHRPAPHPRDAARAFHALEEKKRMLAVAGPLPRAARRRARRAGGPGARRTPP